MLTKLFVKTMVYLKTKKGQTLVEYGLILALVAVAVIAVLFILGNQIRNVFNTVTNSLQAYAQ